LYQRERIIRLNQELNRLWKEIDITAEEGLKHLSAIGGKGVAAEAINEAYVRNDEDVVEGDQTILYTTAPSFHVFQHDAFVGFTHQTRLLGMARRHKPFYKRSFLSAGK
jgi:hypothetical protein